MGLEIDRIQFEEADYARFANRLRDGLGELLQRPGFGLGSTSIGAELELSLVDRAGLPLPINRAVLAATLDPEVDWPPSSHVLRV